MKNKLVVFTVIIAIIVSFSFFNKPQKVYADQLSDNIDEQMGKINLEELEKFFDENVKLEGGGVVDFISNLLDGKFDNNAQNAFGYLGSIFFNGVKQSLPSLISIVIIAVLCGILQGLKSNALSQNINDLISFIGLLAIILLIFSQIVPMWNNAKIIIENIAKLITIMSPIITTLMVAGGANVSASIYSPTVATLSNVISNVMLGVLLPLVGVMFVFSIISNFSNSVKLTKFVDFAQSTIKWILGIIATIFTVFLSIQGIASATYDGVSIKAAKYAISNSIPLVGGFLRDGFDLVIAGSVLIKNSVGIVCLFGFFIMIISPVIKMSVFSLMLKACSAIIEPISDPRISNFCTAISKCINFLIAVILVSGFMFFICVLLMIFTANAFV